MYSNEVDQSGNFQDLDERDANNANFNTSSRSANIRKSRDSYDYANTVQMLGKQHTKIYFISDLWWKIREHFNSSIQRMWTAFFQCFLLGVCNKMHHAQHDVYKVAWGKSEVHSYCLKILSFIKYKYLLFFFLS